MELFGYFATVLIGLALGIIGGGGSTIAVPILVYLFHVEPTLAITYSLFVVGTTSFIGAISYVKEKLIHLRTVVLFGIPSIVMVLITRNLILPKIPNVLFKIDDFEFSKGLLMLILFAVLMLISAYKMIAPAKEKPKSKESTSNIFSESRIAFQGAFVGLVTGLIGAGGGFLIIPVLVIFGKIKMKEAIGTSLFIITINSLIGFFSGISQFTIDWNFLVTITCIAIAGVIIGIILSKKIDGKKLKPAFGWFILVMGTYILAREIFNYFQG
jgi:hypothetical protein